MGAVASLEGGEDAVSECMVMEEQVRWAQVVFLRLSILGSG